MQTVTFVNAHGDRQSGVECDDPADGRCLHARVAVAENDVVDGLGRHPGAFQQAGERGHAQFDGGQAREHAAVAADRGAYRLADDDVVPTARVALTHCPRPLDPILGKSYLIYDI